MKKRGQVSLFVIIGVLVVAVIILLFYFRGEIAEGLGIGDVEKQLEVKLQGVSQHIGDCIEDESANSLQKLALNGGTYDPAETITYLNVDYRVLCRNMENGCVANPLVKKTVEDMIKKDMEERLNVCINLGAFEGDAELIIGERKLDVSINEESVRFDLDMPVKIIKDTYQHELKVFTKIINVPLFKTIEVVNDVINVESTGLDFNPVTYGQSKLSSVEVGVQKPYPNEIYTVEVDESGYLFYFVVGGENA